MWWIWISVKNRGKQSGWVSKSKMNEMWIATKIFCTHSIRGEHCSAAAYENHCLDMDPTAPVCNLEWQDGNFIIAYSSAECSAPFKLAKWSAPSSPSSSFPSETEPLSASSSVKPVDCNNFNSVFGHPGRPSGRPRDSDTCRDYWAGALWRCSRANHTDIGPGVVPTVVVEGQIFGAETVNASPDILILCAACLPRPR